MTGGGSSSRGDPRSETHKVIDFDHFRNRLQRFSGAKSKIKVASWIALFEVTAEKLDTDKEKITFLMHYLDDEALQWYADEICESIDEMTFDEVKQAMKQRFGERTIEPVLAAQRRRLQKGETVQQYYEDKMYLLRKTGLSEMSMAEILTDGMPHYYRTPLIASSISSVSDWLNKAVRLESSFASRPERESQPFRPQAVAATAEHSYQPKGKQRPQQKKKPPNPCKFCKALDKTEYHWHNECPNRQNHGNKGAAAAAVDDEREVINVISKNL